MNYLVLCEQRTLQQSIQTICFCFTVIKHMDEKIRMSKLQDLNLRPLPPQLAWVRPLVRFACFHTVSAPRHLLLGLFCPPLLRLSEVKAVVKSIARRISFCDAGDKEKGFGIQLFSQLSPQGFITDNSSKQSGEVRHHLG